MSDSVSAAKALMHANLIDIFGQRDHQVRREAIRRTYATDIAFTDPEGTVHGHDAIEEKVGALLDNAPATFVFAPDGPLYVLGATAAALPWTFGPAGGPSVARGIDVAEIADGRISALQTLLAD